ncbi:hypothetical protein FACS1894186_2420 [Alphaproteobacteria bacterium]|nr:hypothetical protein FACS1894186_2420 [Alphaproteobacteria bacterium]
MAENATDNDSASPLMKIIKSPSSLANIVMSGLGLAFFGVAAFMIRKQLAGHSFADIKEAAMAVSGGQLTAALAFVVLSYLALALYDFTALHYIGKRAFLMRWLLAGAAGFAVSNNAGHAFISGTAIRYHLYRRWGFTIPDIVKMVTFSSFTYLMGCFTLMILGVALTGSDRIGTVPPRLTDALLAVSAAGLALYLAGSLLLKAPLAIRNMRLYFPSFRMALCQMALGTVDVVFAALVLYSVLAAQLDIDFSHFLGVFLIAQVLGTFSQVPGGIGVFESIFFYVMASRAGSELPLIGGLLLYRALYYFLPLALAFVLVMGYEAVFRWRLSRMTTAHQLRMKRLHPTMFGRLIGRRKNKRTKEAVRRKRAAWRRSRRSKR